MTDIGTVHGTVHGEIRIDRDDPAAVAAGTSTLLREVRDREGLCWDDVVGIVCTMTPDLTSGFPPAADLPAALADVPMLCAVEMDVPESPPRVVRLVAHVRTRRPRSEEVAA